MTSSEERREAAREIRQFLSVPPNERAWDNSGLQTVGRLVGASVGENILARLADLIDPTCHVVTSGERRGRPIGSACSVCHAPLYPSTAWAHGMRYCSQCGSRVVDDGK